MEEKKYSWNDVTIQMFYDIVEVLSSEELNASKKSGYCYNILKGLDIMDKAIFRLSPEEFVKEVQNVNFIQEKIKENPMSEYYTIGGKEFKLVLSSKHMETGQFIDYLNTSESNYHKIASIILLPKGCKWYGGDKSDNTEYDPNVLSKFLKDNMKITDILGICFFFQLTYLAYSKGSQVYSTRKLQKKMKKEKNPVVKKLIEETVKLSKMKENRLQWDLTEHIAGRLQ